MIIYIVIVQIGVHIIIKIIIKQLHTPNFIRVGFNKRSDTYSGLLSFPTYLLEDGATTKHKNRWVSWIDKSIPTQDVENVPTEGFVLNERRGGGGSWRYNDREPKIRVWDPRGWEFEITIENALDILAECGSLPGKGLVGKFVYSFADNKLNLISEKSEVYKNSLEFTSLSSMKITEADLVVGSTYLTKVQNNILYLGKFNFIETTSYNDSASLKHDHVFFKLNSSGKPDE